MEIKTSLFSLFGRVGRLGAISPITQGEIAQEISYRNYTTGQATEPVPTTITRADAIKFAVNRGLDASGLPRKATALTYLDVVTMSNLIGFCTTWANWYLSGAQSPALDVQGLRGLRGRNMRGLGEYEPVIPNLAPPTTSGTNGWAILVTFLGTAITTYGQYLLAKQQMANAGYEFNPLTRGQYSAYPQLRPYEPAPKETPTWVWVAGGLAAVYLLTQRKTA